MTTASPSLLSSLALITAEHERAEREHWLSELRATQDVLSATQVLLEVVRHRAWAGTNLMGTLRSLLGDTVAGGSPTAEEWASVGVRVVIPAERGSVLDRPTGPEADPLAPDADEGDIYPDLADEDARPSPAASSPPPSAPPAQPLPPTRRPPPPPAAPIQDPPRPVPAEAREGDLPDPGPTVALRRPVVLACSTIEEAKSCRRWPKWEAHAASLEGEVARIIGLLQEIEAAEQAGDAGLLREIRERKLLGARLGVAARCQAALDRLLEPPSTSPSPVVAPVVSEPVSAEQGAVEPVVVETPPPAVEGIDLGACSYDSPV